MKLITVIKNHVYKTLEENNWNRKKTSRDLGITLWKLKSWVFELRKDGKEIPDPRPGRAPVNGHAEYDPFRCDAFPTNEERIKYKDSFPNRYEREL